MKKDSIYNYEESNQLNKKTSNDDAGTIEIKKAIASEVILKMESQGISKKEMADLMSTSRSSLDRLLDPNNTSITLKGKILDTH
jgi:predicted XRE-type DNA-binding protein